MVILANGCWEEERSAPLDLQANIMSSNGELLVDWAGYNANGFTDCCFWKRVKCSLKTGGVIKLNFGTGDGFSNMKVLDLQFNPIHPKVLLSSLCWISSLEVLRLGAYVGMSKKCGGLSNLRELWFEGYEINDINMFFVLGANSGLRNLEKLIFNDNNFNSTIFSSLKIFPYLKHLNLTSNEIDGNIEMNDIIDLSNLEYLDLSDNNIESFATTKGTRINAVSLILNVSF
ncbi:hypothetical protein MTR67_034328 [Solanum verrucosum]|uniref:Leucine-rich repeat-containing N-terminal plant-type domain-containing protein n=1 Tax=Solanum verrucosum TaxID=315347 RepID=A0AAF0U7K3_SOLVR|nr:hypothetical protein MTR67_034328 [Solanum verrucosum]